MTMKMTVKRKRAKVSVTHASEDVSKLVREGMQAHPDVQLVLEIAARAVELNAAQIPIDFELVPTTTTATASSPTGQYPFEAV